MTVENFTIKQALCYFLFCIFFFGDRCWQPAVTSASSLETAGCLQRTFAVDSQANIYGWYTDKK